jgi:glycosyltransferase involved in cell wall biosynthesis
VKILNVNSLLDPVTGGGTAERTLQISLALKNEGAECRILTTDIGFENGLLPRLDGLNVTAYQCLLKRFYIPRVSFASIKKEVEWADVIHIMGHWSVLNALVYLAAHRMQKPYVVCPAGALPIYGRSKILKAIYNWIIGRRIIRDANAWIAITEDERAHFEAYGIDRKSVVVIPNGINPDDFSETDVQGFRKKHGLGNHPFILFLGRLNPIKGPDLLLEAFCRGQEIWPEWHLVFAGPDGGLLDSLKKNAAASAVFNRVHFVGYVGGEEKSAAYQSAQLLVIPSRQEAMSIVVLEAGISGVPVLLTDQCGFDVVGRVGGGVVTTATVDGLQNGLANLLNGKMNLDMMGGKLKDYVKSNYIWRVVIQNYLDLYAGLLRKI